MMAPHPSPGVGLDSELGGSSQAEDDYLPIVKVVPTYPRTPQSRGLQGYCDLEFTVTPLGTTADVRVIECTSSLFEQASVEAALKFKYKPRLVNGTAIAVPGVRHRMTFRMDERSQQAVESGLLDEHKTRAPEAPKVKGEALPIVRVEPQYPREALMDGTEGYVRFELLVGTDGSVLEIKITEAAPGRLFVRNAVRAVRRWKFKPHIVDGVAVEPWVKTSIEFDLDS